MSGILDKVKIELDAEIAGLNEQVQKDVPEVIGSVLCNPEWFHNAMANLKTKISWAQRFGLDTQTYLEEIKNYELHAKRAENFMYQLQYAELNEEEGIWC